jgi:hypothetical protein
LFCVGATPHRWIHRRARQLLLRINIVFDIQRQHQTRIAFEPQNVGIDGSVCSMECTFETIIYILHLGNNLEAPEAPETPGISTSDYRLCRSLVLETFLCTFRVLSLQRKPLTFEQEDLLRRKVDDICHCWESQEPLLPIEDLVFRHLLPATLDDIQDHDGQSNLHFVACQRFSHLSYQSDRVSNFTIYTRGPS